MTKTPLKVAVYVRLSLDRNGEGVAVERQREDCVKLCEIKGWAVASVYSDNDKSAYSTKVRRPGYERMLADAQAGKIDGIMSWQLDRLVRRVVDLDPLLDLEIPIASVVGELDLSTASGRMLARVLATIAQHEVELKSERQVRANVSSAKAGRAYGGLPPFGFKRVPDPTDQSGRRARFVQVPKHAAAIRRAYRGLLATNDPASLRAIARDWNDAGLRTARGNPWEPRAVRDCLLGAANAGMREHNGEIIGPAAWTKIVPYDVWADAKALLTQPERRTTDGNARKYVLSGLTICGKCGGRMRTGRNSRNQRHTRKIECASFKHLSLAAEPIEAYLREVVTQRLSRPDARRLLVESPTVKTDRAQRKAVELRERRDRLPRLFAASGIPEAEVLASVADLNEQIAELERSFGGSGKADVLRDVVTARNPERVWDELDVHRKRAVIDALMTVTLVSPGRGKRTFQPGSVLIDWR